MRSGVEADLVVGLTLQVGQGRLDIGSEPHYHLFEIFALRTDRVVDKPLYFLESFKGLSVDVVLLLGFEQLGCFLGCGLVPLEQLVIALRSLLLHLLQGGKPPIEHGRQVILHSFDLPFEHLLLL